VFSKSLKQTLQRENPFGVTTPACFKHEFFL
jgi:hypothetical protein